jgi:hypothetical protein
MIYLDGFIDEITRGEETPNINPNDPWYTGVKTTMTTIGNNIYILAEFPDRGGPKENPLHQRLNHIDLPKL